MRIELQRLDQAFHMQATNSGGNIVEMDASRKAGGSEKGFRPMQMLLAALGGCSTIDIVKILKKQRQPLEDIRITIDGEREPGVEPSLFRRIHAHFELTGQLDTGKVQRAIDLSMEKYCSVAKTLEYTATITYDFAIRTPSRTPPNGR